MGLEKVREEVLEQARKQADAILRAARSEAESIEGQSRARMEQEKRQANEELGILLDEIERQELSQAKLDARNALLQVKKELIELALAKAQQKLAKLKDEEKRQLYAAMLKHGQASMKVVHVYCNKDDILLVKKLGNLNVHPAPIPGGLIVENEQQTVRLDMSFSSILEGVKEERLTQIHKILFASAGERIGQKEDSKREAAKQAKGKKAKRKIKR
ncbi:hypothetical protein HYV81_02230 [Candidatus Woesearchaeota archaeon]|nr:hypothetical protein [Candidatus Woesearchaeota archaeon]